VDHLTWFTAESFGGPNRFSCELGFRHLIDVHRHLNITEEQRQRFVELYLQALDAVEMPDDKAFREAVRSHVEFGSKVAMQNSHAVTCPQGKTSRSWYETAIRGRPDIVVQFAAATCRACPARAQCTTARG
jgi:hypothetical protein